MTGMQPCTFINAIDAPADREEKFIDLWDQSARYVAAQPGFVFTSLHRAVSPGARHQFFTVAGWRSSEDFRTATSTAAWNDLRVRFRAGLPGFSTTPTVCQVIRDPLERFG